MVGAKAKAGAKRKATRKSIHAQVLAEKRKCNNALHFVLKSKFDVHFVNSVRQLVLATGPECSEDSFFRSQVLEPEDVRLYFANLAGGAWEAQLRASLATLRDRTRLRKGGHHR